MNLLFKREGYMNTSILPAEPGKQLQLLERVKNRVKPNETFNILHLLHESLNTSSTPRLDVTETLEEIIEDTKYNRLRRLIETMITYPLSNLPQLENNVPTNAWLERWEQRAQSEDVDITDIFIVWEVIE